MTSTATAPPSTPASRLAEDERERDIQGVKNMARAFCVYVDSLGTTRGSERAFAEAKHLMHEAERWAVLGIRTQTMEFRPALGREPPR
jgi:hypothetical protein